MDNARAHLHSGDFNSREKHREKAELQRRAMGRTDSREVKERLGGASKSGLVEFLRACHGARVHEVFKVAERHGGVAERAPRIARSSSP